MITLYILLIYIVSTLSFNYQYKILSSSLLGKGYLRAVTSSSNTEGSISSDISSIDYNTYADGWYNSLKDEIPYRDCTKSILGDIPTDFPRGKLDRLGIG